jgi:hypothetical protein
MLVFNKGDFGQFKFIERYKNGHIIKRYYDLHGTVSEVFDDRIELRDNDTTHVYKILMRDIKFFNKKEKKC